MTIENPTPELRRSIESWANLDPQAAAFSSTKAMLAILLEEARADILALAALKAQL